MPVSTQARKYGNEIFLFKTYDYKRTNYSMIEVQNPDSFTFATHLLIEASM